MIKERPNKMETIKMTSGEFFKSIRIVHLALIAGIVLFAATSILLHSQGFETIEKEVDKLLIIFASVLTLFGIFASHLIFKKKINAINKQSSIKEKMTKYRTALIFKFALIEGPSFFSVIAYLLTGNYIYLVIALILIIVFLIYTPSKDKLIMDLELTNTEAEIIRREESEIN